MTYYNVFLENNRLDIEYNPRDSRSIIFPEGNRDIEFLVSFLILNLRYGYEAVYDPSPNKISFSTSDPITPGGQWGVDHTVRYGTIRWVKKFEENRENEIHENHGFAAIPHIRMQVPYHPAYITSHIYIPLSLYLYIHLSI
jgi:hypothetical protein